MSNNTFDVIVIGAGSVGMPAAMYLAEKGMKVLCLDQYASSGQGCNKAAIGGIRATHSSPAKIKLCLDSIRTFSTWKEQHGFDVEWHRGGYVFVAYRPAEEKILKDLLKIQQAAGLNIAWHDAEELLQIAPGLKREGLIGGTYSPEDGSASPMRSSAAFHHRAMELGVTCLFHTRVDEILHAEGQVAGVRTSAGDFAAKWVINAAGSQAKQVAQAAGLDAPVFPDCHEAGITEGVQHFLDPMIVDIRPVPGSKNYYFYQHGPGQVVFCITPDPAIVGSDRRETSSFLPQVARRMVDLMPRLANLKVRRTWRGLYPMTPDGAPVIGERPELRGYVDAVGMCGQGYMLGPGVGALLSRLVTGTLTPDDREILHELRHDRVFEGTEALK